MILMENKVLVKIIVPLLDDSFDCFIPVNEVIWKIKKLIIKSISDLTNTNLDLSSDYIFINKDNGRIYNTNEIVINTDIRNGSELIMLIRNDTI